jgi:hypothetical protein
LAETFAELSPWPNGVGWLPKQKPGDERIATLNGQVFIRSLKGAVWVPNEAFRAQCDPDAHAVPNPGCSCGVYAVRRRDDLANVLNQPPRSFVVGLVALWGKMLEYEFGYRAEMAYPAGLIRWPDLDAAQSESFQRCTRLYRVPVIGTTEEHRGGVPVPVLR